MRPLVPWVVLVLLIGLITLFASARSLQHCGNGVYDYDCSSSSSSRSAVSTQSSTPRWYGFKQPPAWYPTGDCATECTHSPAANMRKCAEDAAKGIPATSCKTLSDPDICPTLRYLDAVLPEHYCMPRFEAHCAHPDNIGCSSRCALYIIINYHCVTDAYDPVTRTFNASCKYCNVCWDRSGSNTVGARKAPYALLQARGASGALFVNHWLVLPKAPCSGIESTSPGCTDSSGEYLWANAYHEALQRGFSYSHGPPNWAMMLNSPNRRGVHQLHIHIAHFDSSRSNQGIEQSNWLVRKVAQHAGFSSKASSPTRILGEGYYDPGQYKTCSPLHRPPRDWARTYAVFMPTKDPVNDLGRSIKPFELARQLSAASGEPSHGYGLMLMPRKLGAVAGVIVGIVWSTDDWEQLDVSEMHGDPIGFSHTCHNYIGL